jgi:glycosyltransferase involved in cell wall biosynthesis
MACGRPCVVTDVGDSAILVAETGFSTPPGNPESLAEAMLHLIKLPHTEHARLGAQARQRITENFDLQKMVNKYTSLYNQMGKDPQKYKPGKMPT